jgi:hypothetical protein
MEKAIILGSVSHSLPHEILEDFKSINGVMDAELIFGPYDFYVVIQAVTREGLADAVLKIRSARGVASTMTCYAVTTSFLRPDSKE